MARIMATAIASLLLAISPAWGVVIEIAPAAGGGSADRDASLVRQQGGISFASGGVGDVEERELRAMAKDFNLAVTLATPDGHFLGGARIRILDAAGRPLVEADADGPLFFARLPAGGYAVEATTAGRTERENVSIADGKRADIRFAFPTADGGPR